MDQPLLVARQINGLGLKPALGKCCAQKQETDHDKEIISADHFETTSPGNEGVICL